jgi:hypothetical protein
MCAMVFFLVATGEVKENCCVIDTSAATQEAEHRRPDTLIQRLRPYAFCLSIRVAAKYEETSPNHAPPTRPVK